MKIGILSNLYPPHARGGAEQLARRIAHELHVRGHEVFIISSQPFSGKASLVNRRQSGLTTNYRFFPLNLYHLLNDYKHPFFLRALWHLIDMWNPFSGWKIRKILHNEQPDVIITHNLKGLGMSVLKEVRRRGIRHIHTLHDVQYAIPSGLLICGQEESFLNRSFLQTWYENQMKKLLGSPDIVLSPSVFLKEFYEQKGFFPDSTVELLPNPAPKFAQVHRRPYDASVLRIMFASQLEKHKGTKFLLDVLNEFDRSFELHVAGEGTLAEYVDGWAKRDKRLRYHGFVSLENLRNLFEISDVVVAPSLCYEGSPTIIYEALQAGVPVIASDIGGVGELVEDGKNGVLITPGDPQSLRDALHRLADGRDGFHERAEEIRATVKNYSMDHYVDTLEQFLK